jgi:hypothetical protein
VSRRAKATEAVLRAYAADCAELDRVSLRELTKGSTWTALELAVHRREAIALVARCAETYVLARDSKVARELQRDSDDNLREALAILRCARVREAR